jgi:tetratricopeptide (TPR) repeat protein
MKLFFRTIFKIFLILTTLAGCAATEEIALLNQGIAFGKDGKHDRAIASFDKALEINPRYADAYYNRGFAYAIGKGQYDRAISDFNKAIEINPRCAEAYGARGIAYNAIGQLDKACSDWKRACELGLLKVCEHVKSVGYCK